MVLICKLLIFATLLLPISICSLPECSFRAIFNFGDSNSDTGGLSAVFGQAPPPNGETFFHSPAGRVCDGRLLIDFIGKLCHSFFYVICFIVPATQNFKIHVWLLNIFLELYSLVILVSSPS